MDRGRHPASPQNSSVGLAHLAGAVTGSLPFSPRKGTNHMIEIVIGLAVFTVVGYYSYVSGKQVGSRKGFGAGRYGRK